MFDDAKDARIPFRHYVVGFFDILGHSDSLNALRTLPETAAEVSEYRHAVARSIGTVRGFRRLFRTAFESFRDAEVVLPAGPELPNGLAEQVKHFRNLHLTFQGFGDTVVVFFPAHLEDRGFATISIQWLLYTLGTLMCPLLASGVPVRGAIEFGVGAEVFEGEIHGPVLADVYRMESKEAKYPRVLIGDGLWDFIKSIASIDPTDVQKQIAKYAAAQCLSVITQDDFDQRPVLNHVAGHVRNLRKDGGKSFDAAVDGAVAFAEREEGRFRRMKNEELAARYSQLAKFVRANTRMKLPGVS